MTTGSDNKFTKKTTKKTDYNQKTVEHSKERCIKLEDMLK